MINYKMYAKYTYKFGFNMLGKIHWYNEKYVGKSYEMIFRKW